MPACMCSSKWQWNIQMPGSSGTMSTVSICADAFTFFHGHHREIGVLEAVDGGSEIGEGETGTEKVVIAQMICGRVFQLLDMRGIAGVSVNVVLQIPTGIFIDDHEQGDEFAVNVGGP